VDPHEGEEIVYAAAKDQLGDDPEKAKEVAQNAQEQEVELEGGELEEDDDEQVTEENQAMPEKEASEKPDVVFSIEEFMEFLSKKAEAPPIAERKGTDNEDNQKDEEVPTQITDESAENVPPKGVSAKADQTAERKDAEEAQSGEKNEKVASATERGKRDGTGPYKGSLQKKVQGKGKRRMTGEECPEGDEECEERTEKKAEDEQSGEKNEKVAAKKPSKEEQWAAMHADSVRTNIIPKVNRYLEEHGGVHMPKGMVDPKLWAEYYPEGSGVKVVPNDDGGVTILKAASDNANTPPSSGPKMSGHKIPVAQLGVKFNKEKAQGSAPAHAKKCDPVSSPVGPPTPKNASEKLSEIRSLSDKLYNILNKG
jgi:hypothetical protein